MSAPLKVMIGVLPEAEPVLDALARLRVDVGSFEANVIFPSVPPGTRLVCVAVADAEGVIELAKGLRRELAGNDAALALCNKCMVSKLALDARLVAFMDIVAIEARA